MGETKTANGPGIIIVADDHPLFRGALRQAIGGIFDPLTVIEAGTLDEVTTALGGAPEIDLVLLDLKMPGVNGFSGLTYLRAQHPSVPVVIVSGIDDAATIRTCMEFGAAGYIPKTTPIETINRAIRHVLTGGTWTPPDIPLTEGDRETGDLIRRLASLTPQQMRVLTMLSEGLLNKQIAYELSVSEATVKAHVSAILAKLGVESRTQAVIAAARLDLPG
jgi:DNA-binding NarL/FixJ family response regulator